MSAKYKRIVSLDEVRAEGYYADLADLAEIFQHDVVACDGYDASGKPDPDAEVWRWKPNRLVEHICDGAIFYTPPSWPRATEYPGCLSLNGLAAARYKDKFSTEEYMKFYMQMGYSLSGFCEVFGQNEASEYPDLRENALPVPEDHDGDSYVETVIDYMIRVHKGKALRF